MKGNALNNDTLVHKGQKNPCMSLAMKTWYYFHQKDCMNNIIDRITPAFTTIATCADTNVQVFVFSPINDTTIDYTNFSMFPSDESSNNNDRMSPLEMSTVSSTISAAEANSHAPSLS